MEKIKVDGLNGLRFTPIRKSKGCFAGHSNSILNPNSGINPNKAVFTIDSKTSNILIVNRNACDLLGYTSKELCDSGIKFSNLLACKNKIHVSALAENQFNSEDGTMILLSGKVVEMIHKNGQKIPVSLWIRQIDNIEGRCLAVAEPVERRVAQLLIDQNGIIINGDNEALLLFQLESLDKFIGMDIALLIPAIQLPTEPFENHLIPKHIRKQRATGKTQDGLSFPLCLLISIDDNEVENPLLTITIWVYSNISGLIVIDENSIIESCNHHFSTLMFGYAQSKIIGKNIFNLIPNFGQEFEYIDIRNQKSPCFENEESETETDHILFNDPFSIGGALKTQKDPFKICLDFTSPRGSRDSSSYGDSFKVNNSVNERSLIIQSNGLPHDEHELLTPVNETGNVQITSQEDEKSMNKSFISSTPDGRKRLSVGPSSSLVQQFNYNYVDGKYKGEAVHADGNIIDIVYTIYKHTLTATNNTIYLVWMSRDHHESTSEDIDEEKQFNLTLTLNSITSTIDTSACGAGLKNEKSSAISNTNSSIMLTSATAGTNTLANITSTSRPNSLSVLSQCEDEQISGDYCKFYTTLKQIGKGNIPICMIKALYCNLISYSFIFTGAYGYVKMAYRNSDRLLVISKFILKEKLCSNFMITTDDKKEIPMEIYLLRKVNHPNIVTVLDVYENEKFFQLIMEKHGSGMDLFEFIDRRPLMDEKLGCFIFRQIAKAVDYLHSLNILHRDIKDENIIIDQNFHIKLIDFGSATFMEEGKMFATFYGTTEYCSPEVLAGNKYRGPELEIWSLGVTLYVLIFFENPFLDMEDTLRAELMIPQDVSIELENLLMRMLDKDPRTRMTMRELIGHDWITQEINNNFDFASIVPCEDHEAHPEVYYTGQVFSSATVLSTSHDSLSLVDDESICEDIEDVNFDNETHVVASSNILKTQNFNDLANIDDTRTLPKITTSRSKTGNKIIQKNGSTLNDENATQQQNNQQQISLKSPSPSPSCNNSSQKVLITSCCSHAEKNCPTLLAHPPNSLYTIYPNSNSNPLTTSKSENNIFDKHNLSISYTTNFEVVNSLSDLSDDLNYYDRERDNNKPMNDLSKPQILNQFSDEDSIDDNFHRF
jgi:PAS domain containing serine/threonine kinase